MLIVQKYGGTSVANPERIQNAAARIAEYWEKNDSVVVVVSAMSGVTDSLIKMAHSLIPSPNRREMDVLLATGEQTTIALMALALHARGIPATSLTGAQAGIKTDRAHTRAKIKNISPTKIRECLSQGHVVIVAGFQGETDDRMITTLGRGGSDLSAIALAAALKADLCQIYTDVDGVFTADPRLVPDALKLAEISYDEMLELASLGAKVMQSRSIEFAKKFEVVFEVRSSMNNKPGTIVKEETKSMEDVIIRGISMDKNQAKLTLSRVPDKPGSAANVFKALGGASINVDMIIQNNSPETAKSATDISFTVDKPNLKRAHDVLLGIKGSIGFAGLAEDDQIAKISIVGVGMKSHSGVAALMFGALADAGINIIMISTSEIKISVIVDLEKADEALRALHAAFFPVHRNTNP
jgi:aspartate kinase